MIFEFGTATQISQSIYSILLISLVLTSLMCLLVYKVFGVNKWAVLVAGLLMVSATTTFSTFNLSTMFYRLEQQSQQLVLFLAVPNEYEQRFDIKTIKYVDAITPDPKKNKCHVVLEDVQGMLYQSLDIEVTRCKSIQQSLMQSLQLKPRPPKPKSKHSPPLPPAALK